MLTDKQRQVFDYIVTFVNDTGYAPAYTDIADRFKFKSVATVRTYLEYLEKKGFIRRHGKARSLEIVYNPFKTPILGNIKAGNPTDAIEDFVGHVQDLDLLQSSDQRFSLRVKGDSMKNAGIFEGDFAIIDRVSTVVSGMIVAALLGEEATLKRYKDSSSGVFLMPENPAYEPIKLCSSLNVTILGTCVGVIRSYD